MTGGQLNTEKWQGMLGGRQHSQPEQLSLATAAAWTMQPMNSEQNALWPSRNSVGLAQVMRTAMRRYLWQLLLFNQMYGLHMMSSPGLPRGLCDMPDI